MKREIQINKQPWCIPQITEIKVKLTEMPSRQAEFSTDSYAVAMEDPLMGELAGDLMLTYQLPIS